MLPPCSAARHSCAAGHATEVNGAPASMAAVLHADTLPDGRVAT